MSQSTTKPDEMTITAPIVSRDEDRPLIYVNGRIVPKSQATVSVFDHGLLYGDGVFEGIRIYQGRIFKAQQHLDRLWASAGSLGIKIHISREEMLDIQRRCVEANEIVNGYIRLLVTRGDRHTGTQPDTTALCRGSSVLPIRFGCIRNGDVRERDEGCGRRAPADSGRVPGSARIKSLNYLNNILAKTEALDKGMFEVIMLNTDGLSCARARATTSSS